MENEQRMDKYLRAWLILAIVVVVAILAFFWATSGVWFSPFPFERRGLPPGGIPGDIEFYYTAKTVVSTINVTLLVILMFIYGGIYEKTRSEFTVGLIIFSAVLLLHAITTNPIVTWFFGFQSFGLGPFALLPDVFTLAGLFVLLYLSVKY